MPRIEIGEVRYFVEQFLRESKRLRDALRDYRKAVAKLVADGEIQGEFVYSAKSYYETIHYPIVDTTVECLSEADRILKKYVQDFESQVDDSFDSRLDSDKLDALYAEIRRSENLLDDFTHAMDSMTGNLNLGQQIGMKLGLETSMMQIKEEIKVLERYLDFEHSHTNVMHDVLSRMYQVKTGVNEILAGKAFNGTTHMYDSSKMQLGWLNHLVPEKKPKKTYNFDDYTKTLEGGYWVLSKNGVIDQESAKATIAYNDGLKDGTIKREVEDADIDFETEYMLAAMEGYNLLTGEPITKAQSFSIISAVLLGAVAMKGRGIKVPKSRFSKIQSDLKIKATKDLEIKNISKKIMATKPMNSPVPEKWIKKGGSISIDSKGTWSYTNKNGQTVRYPNGYPDFKDYRHPDVEPVTIKVASPKNPQADFRAANLEAKLDKNSQPPVPELSKPPIGYTWHHHEDGMTMELVEAKIHKDFRHIGGQSAVNGKINRSVK
ncbi:T7SS effector LXG polymorphic toxin [Listeria rocourtiae]|uniref:T7SS effector LXG polymorphic toxin n=1 Tax=Listeria rocourtiae TaxID=647910 RepID=UPI003D2F6BE9